MKSALINKSDIRLLLKEASREWNIYAPLEVQGGDVNFCCLPKENIKEALNRVTLDDKWIPVPPKDLFFPQLESLFEIKKNKIEETVEYSKKLLFGIKAYDYQGILFSDEFFKRTFQDNYYLSRTKDRLVIIKSCLTPPRQNACFCTSAKTGPFLDKDFDIQLVDIGEAYLVEIGSKRGEDFILKYKRFFKLCSNSEVDKALTVKEKAVDSIELKIDFSRAVELMKGKEPPEEIYKKIAQRCIHCGGCIYVCPTCTCFNVFDDKENEAMIRYRNWDTCVFEGFTREASGFNPRETKWLRASRRYEHKLWYDYKTTGKSGCVGCGRCLTSCPVELGMSKFIQEITA
ncbi:MAG: 4Fe-4S dicluster domain-containing protein [Candidatus Omnitrophica bacterium]|nr:4Fe-4S dicluster domain-containing protein [Candidatus Omnitrophota bacterium]